MNSYYKFRDWWKLTSKEETIKILHVFQTEAQVELLFKNSDIFPSTWLMFLGNPAFEHKIEEELMGF